MHLAQAAGVHGDQCGGDGLRGLEIAGNCDAIAGFCGPGSVKLDGLPVVLIAPWGGWSGLPNVCATAAVATVPAAAAASTLRRDTGSIEMPPVSCGDWADA